VCGEAATCEAALKIVEEARPALVIVDLALGHDDGLSLVKTVKSRHPAIPCLVLSMHDESVFAERCLRAGAMGYIGKGQLDETLLVAIRRILEGGMYMSDALMARLAARHLHGGVRAGDSPVGAMSDRQLQVFRLIGHGRTTREIAESLELSIKTVESHREHIKQKLGIKSSAALAQRATQWVEAERIG
jgi:DNA-binding NarL/FixJ family response regulator